MRRQIFSGSVLIILIFWMAGCTSQKKTLTLYDNEKKWIENTVENAVSQYEHLIPTVPEELMAYTIKKDGSLKNVSTRHWVSGFYPGTLLYLYMFTGNDTIYQEALKRVEMMREQQYMTTNHDIGFMMYSSYGNLYKIDPQKEYEQILINSAYSLAKRYNPDVESIRSWGEIEDNENFIVIIDNMMNLELLLWASKKTGDKFLYDVAIKHANTTIKNHFRPDYSTYHAVDYDPITGKVKGKRTVQGYNDDSAWARGQAWGLYGFTMMYRETGVEKYLDMANGIANFILTHPNLPKDKVPYWDFNDPKIPNTYKDASAGAIIASALIELSKYNKKESKDYLDSAIAILKSLSTPAYTAEIGTNGGFILKHSIANLNKNADVDVPLSYADYYFMEALYRYKNYDH